MRLVDIEKQLKVLIEQDISDPEVYRTIYKLSYLYIKRKHLMSTTEAADQVAHLMAQDLYLKIYNGKEIHSWLGYMSKCYHSYIRDYNRINKSEIIDVEGNYDLKEGIISMSTSNDNSNYDFSCIEDKDYILNLMKVVDRVLVKSKYCDNSKVYLNSKLSIILSFSKGHFIYYNLPEGEVAYTKMLYLLCKDIIKNHINELKVSSFTNSLSLIQLYTMSNNTNESE